MPDQETERDPIVEYYNAAFAALKERNPNSRLFEPGALAHSAERLQEFLDGRRTDLTPEEVAYVEATIKMKKKRFY